MVRGWCLGEEEEEKRKTWEGAASSSSSGGEMVVGRLELLQFNVLRLFLDLTIYTI